MHAYISEDIGQEKTGKKKIGKNNIFFLI